MLTRCWARQTARHGAPAMTEAGLFQATFGQHLRHRRALQLHLNVAANVQAYKALAHRGPLPAMPPAETTSSPLAKASIMALCSF